MQKRFSRKIKYITLILVITILLVSISGCVDGKIDVSKLMEKPIEYVMPVVKHVDANTWKADPDVLPEYEGYYMDVNPIFGDKLRITQVEILPQLIMQAYNDKSNVINYEFKQRFKNEIIIYNADNEIMLELEIASDGSIFARTDKKSAVIRLPEYVYFALEGCLWKMGDAESEMSDTACSLIEPLSEWAPSMGESAIELRLAHDVKTMLYLMYGYSESIFVNYKIYSTLELDRQYKIYMLLSYEGYEYVDDTFWPRYREIIPTQLIYSWVEGDFWSLSEMKFAAYNEKNKLTETKIRKILPYLDTKSALEDLADTISFEEELQRQALEYLTTIGKGDIRREERK